MQQVYLDNAATTPLLPEVIEAVREALVHYANPSSLHAPGAEAEKTVSRARADVAALLNADPANLIFTSGGTEANNLAVKGLLARAGFRGRLITSTIEHPSVLEVFQRLETEGWDVVRIPVDAQGQVSMTALEQALDVPTVLVSIMAVNNEIGAVQPLEDIARLVKTRQPKAIMHTDAVQALGKIPFNPARLGVDMASFSAHKIHGPKGIGALYLAKRDLIQPLLDGGGQEGGLRSGTENVPGIAGFGMAARVAKAQLEDRMQLAAGLRAHFLEGLNRLSCRVVSPDSGVPHIIAAAFPGYRGEVLLQALSGEGIYVSTGAACSGRKGNLSHVAKAIGLDEQCSTGLLRFSFSAMITVAEIDYTLGKIEQVLDELAFVRGRRTR